MPKSYYPPKTFKDAMQISKNIFEKNAGNPMFRVTLATELDLFPEGHTFRKLITASSGYGLTIGSNKAEIIELTKLGEALAKGSVEAVFDAIFSVDLFSEFYKYFGTSGSKVVPSEKALADFLRTQLVPERQFTLISKNILADARECYLIQEISGEERFVPLDLAKQTAGYPSGAEPQTQKFETQKTKESKESKHTIESGSKESYVNVVPNLQLNIEIHIAADTSPDQIETIFKNMKKYLLANE